VPCMMQKHLRGPTKGAVTHEYTALVIFFLRYFLARCGVVLGAVSSFQRPVARGVRCAPNSRSDPDAPIGEPVVSEALR